VVFDYSGAAEPPFRKTEYRESGIAVLASGIPVSFKSGLTVQLSGFAVQNRPEYSTHNEVNFQPFQLSCYTIRKSLAISNVPSEHPS